MATFEIGPGNDDNYPPPVGSGPDYTYDTIQVDPGYTSDSALIEAGGTENVLGQGGFAYFSTVFDGGVQNISSGASAYLTHISAGGTENVYGESDNADVSGTQNVSGGTITYGTVEVGGVVNVSDGGSYAHETVYGTLNDLSDPGSGTGAIIYGTENISAGAESTSATVESGGYENVLGGISNAAVVTDGGYIVVEAGTASGAVVDSGGTLEMNGGTATDVTLQKGAIVDLANVTYDPNAVYHATLIDGELVLNGTPTGVSVSGGESGGDFSVSEDKSGHIELTTNAVCYCRGTRIRTTCGERAVEDLSIGDLVLTASGQARPVRWLGSRWLHCARHPDPAAVWPIRIQAGAFADDLPVSDLWVSPGHSIFIAGVLIQACNLVNGVTITQVPCERVQYWHVELDSHDILLAEGLPAESYLDTGNRTAFVNGGAFLEAHPDFSPKHWADTSVPLVFEGEALHRAKESLLARAKMLGHEITPDADAHVVADGQRIDPVQVSETRMAFVLPPAHSIELRCRSFIPAQVSPQSGDRRALGLCVGRVQFDGVEVPLDGETAFARDWHAMEGSDQHWRWSKDRVALPPCLRLVVIELYGRGYYWTERGAGSGAPALGGSRLSA